MVPLSSHDLPSLHVCVLISSSQKDTSCIGIGPTHMTHFILITFLKVLSPNMCLWGAAVRTSASEIWRNEIQPTIGNQLRILPPPPHSLSRGTRPMLAFMKVTRKTWSNSSVGFQVFLERLAKCKAFLGTFLISWNLESNTCFRYSRKL